MDLLHSLWQGLRTFTKVPISTQLCIPSRSLNRVSASAAVKAEMSPLSRVAGNPVWSHIASLAHQFLQRCGNVHCYIRVHTHTHTHTFNGRYQKDKKTIWILLKQETVSGSGISWQLGHMQVCTSLQTDNHASTPPLSFLQAGCPSCRPTNSVKALKAYITGYITSPQEKTATSCTTIRNPSTSPQRQEVLKVTDINKCTTSPQQVIK